MPDWNSSDWAYMAEGNLHIVLSFVGRSLELRGSVLRVRKRSNKACASLRECHRFGSCVMPTVLGHEYVEAGQLVDLPAPFLRALAVNLPRDTRRPAHRRRGCLGLDLRCQHGVLMPDLTHSPRIVPCRSADDSHVGIEPAAVCVEIKPKSGVPTLSVRSCRFCQHQVLKRRQGKVRHISQYCPMALFAATKEERLEVSSSIWDLLATPQNNFRLFRPGGALLYAEEKWHAGEGSVAYAEGSRHSYHEERRARLAYTNEVLGDVFHHHQAASCAKDAGGVRQAVKVLTSVLVRETVLLQRLKAVQQRDSHGICNLFQMVSARKSEALSLDSKLRALLGDFALATTAKDVSVMVTIQQITASTAQRLRCEGLSVSSSRPLHLLTDPVNDTLGYLDLATSAAGSGALAGAILYSVAVCDLDPKSVLANLGRYNNLQLELDGLQLDGCAARCGAQRWPITQEMTWIFSWD
jgi:hypothetical protein